MDNENPQTEFIFSKNKAILKVQKFFNFADSKTTIKKEVIGGLSTFLAMAYILSLIQEKFSGLNTINDDDQLFGEFGLFLATALVAFAGTFAMGLCANVPIALAPSLGVLSLVISTASNKTIGLEGALISTMLSSILFTIVSMTPIRTIIINAMPKSLNIIIGVGIGLFIAYIGLNDMGLFETTETFQPIASLSNLKKNYLSILMGLGILATIIVLHFSKIEGSIIIGLMLSVIIALIIANSIPNASISKNGGIFSKANFKTNGGWSYDLSQFSTNIKYTWQAFTKESIWTNPTFYISIFLFLFLNFFDATGSLTTFNFMLNKATGQNKKVSRSAMLVDSSTSIFASSIGMSATTTFLESGAGINQGARTGFASIITSLGFIVSIVLFPIFKAIPSCASGAAMVFVGILMFSNVSEVEWNKPEFSIASLFTLIMMVTTYSTVNGMVSGIISYSFIMLITGRKKEVHPMMWILSITFIGYFVGIAFSQG